MNGFWEATTEDMGEGSTETRDEVKERDRLRLCEAELAVKVPTGTWRDVSVGQTIDKCTMGVAKEATGCGGCAFGPPEGSPSLSLASCRPPFFQRAG